MGDMRHNCGLAVAHSLNDVYQLLLALQHRGRDAAGIAAVGDTIDVVKWPGRVDAVGLSALHQVLGGTTGRSYHTYLGHIRYATRGRKERLMEEAHPHVLGGTVQNLGSHMLISNCDAAIVHNGQVDEGFLDDVDGTLLRSSCDTEKLLHAFRRRGENQLMRQVHGAFTMAIADRRRRDVIVMRDRTGIKPGMLGMSDGEYVVASEDMAFDGIKGTPVEELDPGYIYYLAPDGSYAKEAVESARPAHCFFEWAYIAEQRSALRGVNVRHVRASLGRKLAAEFRPADADFVTFLPNCPYPAAEAYSAATKIPFEHIFYKLSDKRAFQGPGPEERAKSIRENLYLLPSARSKIQGKTVIVIDDSIIRGNNASCALELLQGADVKKAYFANYVPPVGIIGTDGIARGCTFGVDMPPDPPPGEAFIARGRTIDQISAHLGAEVRYLSLDGMLETFEQSGLRRRDLCYFCVGGPHPFAGL